MAAGGEQRLPGGGQGFLGQEHYRGNEAREITVGLADYGLDPAKTYPAYDVEEKKFRRAKGTLRATLPPTSFRLIVLREKPGVMWTNSSFEGQETPDGLKITVGGPASLTGHMTVYAPGTVAVYLDDRPLLRAHQVHLSPGTFSYNSRTGVVRLAYKHDGAFTRSDAQRVKDGPRHIRIEVQQP